ncbi:MAG: adenylyltransferase/cytidyltransferase family protein [Dehalococcoidia bacterium]|nr:cytidyltransferase-like protein [Chloroflexota bacterium]|tara:strand:+ start:2886 stop:3311 length:426 start_codon:yes stop_codon:yes gene_type:complete
MRIYVDMVGDLFHFGHVNLLKQARELGDYLIVGVHSDKVVESYKRLPIMTMEERIATIFSCRYVDEVIPNAPLSIDLKWINKHNIDMVVHGNDVSKGLSQNWYKVPIEMGILHLIPYTSGISTTDIIKRCKNAYSIPSLDK